ncbi:TOBE domain-containing protein [Streptomyces sp. NPDC056390]|uniref:TOBE domain-containing protein n=1 Tax=Streptomyces sp. NPDC056390 TaxID=3345806 RepID=UPI0035E270E2
MHLLGTKTQLLPGRATDGDMTAFVRPEALQVEAEPRQEPNGRILSVSFLGSLCHVRIQLDGQDSVIAQWPTAQTDRLTPGTPVRVTLRPVQVFAQPTAQVDSSSNATTLSATSAAVTNW